MLFATFFELYDGKKLENCLNHGKKIIITDIFNHFHLKQVVMAT